MSERSSQPSSSDGAAQSAPSEPDLGGPKAVLGRLLRAVGPAFIVASVVLGPGSILANSRVGADYGLGMVWVLALSVALMIGMVALSGRLGAVLQQTMCDELAQRIGRPFAFIIGLSIFLVCAGFQFGNNVAVVAGLESAIQPLLEDARFGGGLASTGIVVGVNALILIFLFGFKRLYRPIEVFMMTLVAVMILGFAGNLAYLLLQGGAPEVTPTEGDGTPPDFTAVAAVFGTTFSIAGAFFQAYLVREKGWGLKQVKQSLIDSVAGITVLGIISLIIMITGAISFFGRDIALESPADVAQALEPAFGPAAVILFSLGLFAGAFSSFLVNSMIGGAMLADGLGFGGRLDQLSTKICTALTLAVGMGVALLVPEENRVGVIIIAQSMVVLGFPLLALSLVYLASRRDLPAGQTIPGWMRIAAVVGLIAALYFAGRTAAALIERFTT